MTQLPSSGSPQPSTDLARAAVGSLLDGNTPARLYAAQGLGTGMLPDVQQQLVALLDRLRLQSVANMLTSSQMPTLDQGTGLDAAED